MHAVRTSEEPVEHHPQLAVELFVLIALNRCGIADRQMGVPAKLDRRAQHDVPQVDLCAVARVLNPDIASESAD